MLNGCHDDYIISLMPLVLSLSIVDNSGLADTTYNSSSMSFMVLCRKVIFIVVNMIKLLFITSIKKLYRLIMFRLTAPVPAKRIYYKIFTPCSLYTKRDFISLILWYHCSSCSTSSHRACTTRSSLIGRSRTSVPTVQRTTFMRATRTRWPDTFTIRRTLFSPRKVTTLSLRQWTHGKPA